MAAVVFAVLVLVLGWAFPPKPAVISTDRLGPENGEPVADYLTFARETLQGSDSGKHWALMSFGSGITAARIPEFTAGLRVSRVLYHVPLDRVATPVITVVVPSNPAVAAASQTAAADMVAATQAFSERSNRTNAVVAARLRGNCACLVGLVLHGTLPELRSLAALPGVRAVEALPADASAGVFAVAPLLPEHAEYVKPGPDDGPVPDN